MNSGSDSSSVVCCLDIGLVSSLEFDALIVRNELDYPQTQLDKLAAVSA